MTGLDFETPMLEIEARIQTLLQAGPGDEAVENELIALRRQWNQVTHEIYSKLTPWQIVQVSRHKDRPYTRDYLNLAFEEFVELHGDKHFGDDRAILTGFAKIDQFKWWVGHQGHLQRSNRHAISVVTHPEAIAKAMAKMQIAEIWSTHYLVLSTPREPIPAWARRAWQASVIAESMFQMSQLRLRDLRRDWRGRFGRSVSHWRWRSHRGASVRLLW